MTLGEELKQRRRAIRLSQERLAQRLDRSRMTIDRWERGASQPRTRADEIRWRRAIEEAEGETGVADLGKSRRDGLVSAAPLFAPQIHNILKDCLLGYLDELPEAEVAEGKELFRRAQEETVDLDPEDPEGVSRQAEARDAAIAWLEDVAERADPGEKQRLASHGFFPAATTLTSRSRPQEVSRTHRQGRSRERRPSTATRSKSAGNGASRGGDSGGDEGGDPPPDDPPDPDPNPCSNCARRVAASS